MNKEVQRYVDAIQDERKPLFDKLHALIMGLYPIVMSYQIPTYKAMGSLKQTAYEKENCNVETH